jgi:hypothetical protein
MPLVLAVCLGLVALAFQRHYRRQLWDPETVALVNGHPIPREAIEEILSSGGGQSLTGESGSSERTIRLKLERLVEEELVRQAAAECGLVIGQSEIDQGIRDYQASRECEEHPGRPDCLAPRGQAMDSYSKAVAKRLLLERMTKLVSQRHARLDSRRWRIFWRDFLVKHAMVSVFKARILLAQDDPKVLDALERAEGAGSLEAMADAVKAAGFTAMITEPMSLNLLDPETMALFDKAGLSEKLNSALKSPSRMTGPVRLVGSMAVFEAIEAVPRSDPEALAAAARESYQRMEGERAFKSWLADLRARAKIVINPAFQEFGVEDLDSGGD